MRLVLGQDANPANTRIQTVRQREVDDPKFAAKKHSGLCPPIGQLLQPTASTTRED
jgi:hypothetical protein